MKMNLRTMLFLAGMLSIVYSPCAWAHTDVTAEQARELIASTDDLTVVDVREPYEYCDATGHIPGAQSYPWRSGVLEARYEELPADGPILVVCRSGGRSNAAASFLDSKGFSEVYDMLRGMSAWQWETAPCKYSGGSGTPDDPYQIATAEDLIALGETPEDYDKHFIMTADIDLDPNLPGRKAFQHGSGAVIREFSGTFDGSGHTISHLKARFGLFWQLSYGAEVKSLGLVDANISSESVGSVGGLAGMNSHGTLLNCYVTGVVSGFSRVGGLIGHNLGNVINCRTNCTASGGSNIGGLSGQNGGTVINCCSTSTVKGDWFVGGLVGYNDSWVSGTIANCYSTGSVTGNQKVGGLVGRDDRGAVNMSFWDVETSGQSSSAGGIGLTTVEMQDINTYLDAGWDFAGESLNGTCEYWQMSPDDYPQLNYPVMPEGSGTTEAPYLIRDANDLGTTWFEPMAKYRLEASIDLTGIEWTTAVIPSFGGTFDGNGHSIRNLRIEGGGYLGLFGQLYSGARIDHLRLVDFNIRGSGCCVGGLVGDNYGDVTECFGIGIVYGNKLVGGLVGRNGIWSINMPGGIRGCHIEGTISGVSQVGGLVGYNGLEVSNSYSVGMVVGLEYVGGLVGRSDWPGKIGQCYSISTVQGGVCSGGLVGLNSGDTFTGIEVAEVSDCYSIVLENSQVSGTLVGMNGRLNETGLTLTGGFGLITDCYALCDTSGTVVTSGLVGSNEHGEFLNCFWDAQACGVVDSNGVGMPKTTAEMQTARTFIDAGWDFVDETVNGTEDIWWILEGQDYPRLWWEASGQ